MPVELPRRLQPRRLQPRRLQTRVLRVGLASVTVVAVIAYAITAIRVSFGPGPGAGRGWDSALWPVGAYLLLAVCAVAGVRTRSRGDVRSWLLAVSVVLQAADVIMGSVVVSLGYHLEYPSVTDAAGFLSELCLIATLLLTDRRSALRARPHLGLDVLGTACVVGGLILALFTRPRHPIGPGPQHITLDPAYVSLDVAILLAVLVSVAAARLHPGRTQAVVVTGALLFVAGDAIDAVQILAGTFRPGAWPAAVSCAAVGVLAFSLWAPQPREWPAAVPADHRHLHHDHGPAAMVGRVVLPATVAAVSLLLLVLFGTVGSTSTALALFGAGAMVALGRAALTWFDERRASREQRANLLGRLVQAQEDERSRIAADVHDEPVQALAAVGLRLGALRRVLSESAPDAIASVDVVQEIVSKASTRLRDLLFDLEPPPIEAGLVTALSEVADFLFAGADVRWRVHADSDPPLTQAELSTAYRIAKEALTNIRKHAAARQVSVAIGVSGRRLSVVVTDDGRGITPDDEQVRPGHLGLTTMRDRAEAAGGRLDVSSPPEGGTRVVLTIPIAG